ncbi:MAG: hypothetical protein C4305_08255 [Thermoleophilia bacterium]
MPAAWPHRSLPDRGRGGAVRPAVGRNQRDPGAPPLREEASVSYSPVELRHVRLPRSLVGYRRAAVDRLLEEVAESYEAVWRERGELLDRLDQLEVEFRRHREVEELLRSTLVSAERAAQELKEQAKRQADTMLEEARLEAREITRRARAERDALAAEASRLRVLLHAALDALEEAEEGVVGAPSSDPPPSAAEAA